MSINTFALNRSVEVLEVEPTSNGFVPQGSATVTTLTPGQSVTVGRSRAATLKLADMMVSGMHCLLEVKGLLLWVKDLDSTNGTYLAGVRVDQHGRPALNGEILQLGNTFIQIRYVDTTEAVDVD